MSKKVENNNNNKSCIYLYMDGCGPCKAITPIIDTMISCGIPIDKMPFDHKSEDFNRYGTPTILFWDKSHKRTIGRILNSSHMTGLRAVQELGFNTPSLPEYILGEMKKHGMTK